MRTLTSSSDRLKFSIEKQKNDPFLTFNSEQISRHFFNDYSPSKWPRVAYFFNFFACLLLPSMMKPMCSGILPFLSILQPILSMQLSWYITSYYNNDFKINIIKMTKILSLMMILMWVSVCEYSIEMSKFWDQYSAITHCTEEQIKTWNCKLCKSTEQPKNITYIYN